MEIGKEGKREAFDFGSSFFFSFPSLTCLALSVVVFLATDELCVEGGLVCPKRVLRLYDVVYIRLRVVVIGHPCMSMDASGIGGS